ncbi:citrate-Mg2+:H+ or citrate-Ca2+:H+ symporter, CitMHS family [Catalinimonas alkaloidigena]|uniref:Citrate-Mg2+:H+ or citrate-Ca2+:H+ symporter, CitMHS family n=1 Tax=Catalinimonas alkaloidigena TaxID=1075417 RepID=A0A1G9P215_9BACT|nr:citrate:proton symporter [Catalinimonas alkaloidigena]SDL92896.1 citrate-Mg2+:H+ or citrate-Ca2+:H+ symporter, CitMHS family [Catalinimonas alkaloidigena]
MLAFLGLLTIVLLLVLVMARIVSPVVALIAVPIATALAGGFASELPAFMTEGIQTIAPTAVMFIFAILFFGILMDAGTFDPIIARLLRAAGHHPPRITLVTALLAMLVHLDGSGAVTFLVTIPALLPLYDALGMRRTTLATIVALAAGTMNTLPWGGPTLRAATALDVPVTELFNPLLLPVTTGLLTVLGLAYGLGIQEQRRIAQPRAITVAEMAPATKPFARPRLLGFNLTLIVAAVGVLISGLAPPHVIFMVAFVMALTVNYPRLKEQRERIDAHAKAALLMASILLAAGCFTGILKGSGMIDAMANAAVEHIPPAIGNHLAVLTGLVSMPASLLFDPDSFYFGVLPLLGTTAEHFGGEALAVGRGALLGQMTTGFPVSPLTGATFLLIGLTGVDLGDHQRKTMPLAFLVTFVMLVVAIAVSAIPF